jgi:F-type H+-transporting ATPase subunit delta
MSELTTVARPYAKAAFDYAVEKNAVENWNAMLFFAAEVAKNSEIKAFLTGSATPESAAELFSAVCGEQLDDNGKNFIKVLAENDRLLALPQVLELYTALRAEHEKEIEVDVTSATELSEAQQQSLIASLEKRFERKVKLHCSVDGDVVGGLVVKAGDTVIDGTIRSKLDRLAESLQS